MTDIIAALQDEIAAAKKRYHTLTNQRNYGYGEERQLTGYIQGLQTAVDLLTREPARELDF